MGPRSLAQYHRLYLWTLSLGGRDRDRAPEDGFGAAGPADGEQLARAMRMRLADVQDRLRWSRCYVERLQGQIVTYGWVSEVGTPVGEIEAIIRPGPGEAYVWDCATLRPYRGRGLYQRLLTAITSELARDGNQRAWIATLAGNKPGVRGAERAGFHAVLRVRYLRLGPLRQWRVRPAPGAPAEEIDAARRVLELRTLAHAAAPVASPDDHEGDRLR